ncbi:hypothetical protein RCG23_23530 [Neobacillus sp. PS3-34]|uniref:hypothetical protein n=1 Tax=Neobacillus sp. PS3-34 TaxID=3070678 RepID=UPI0027DF17D3|nr:hypothetical protein [Neobacillus sp. PS3-34]WML48197.1 hypothetical protein RCG23_23530 [Neobacillus sp. PS3-34]
MDFNRLFVKEVPFPYFIYDQALSFLAASKQAKELFPHTEDFIQLIDTPFQKEAIDFFLSISRKASIEVLMNEKNKKNSYKIFKAEDEFRNIHIYCLPFKTEMTELQEMMNRVEQKLIQYNVELMDKKQFLEESVQLLKEAAS